MKREGREIDFSKGNSWGHALHGLTMFQEWPSNPVTRLFEWWSNTYRASFMVHCSPAPMVGDILKWKTSSQIIRAPIYKVEPAGNPGDMFTVFVIVARSNKTPITEKLGA